MFPPMIITADMIVEYVNGMPVRPPIRLSPGKYRIHYDPERGFWFEPMFPPQNWEGRYRKMRKRAAAANRARDELAFRHKVTLGHAEETYERLLATQETLALVRASNERTRRQLKKWIDLAAAETDSIMGESKYDVRTIARAAKVQYEIMRQERDEARNWIRRFRKGWAGGNFMPPNWPAFSDHEPESWE